MYELIKSFTDGTIYNSVIVLSKDDAEAAEEYLKIHYPNSKEFLDVPLESNGKVLSKDIIFMDSRISALIIQMQGSKRMVKLKDEYVKEPKEKWKNVKVYAVLKEDCEMMWNNVRSAKNSYPDVTDDRNTRIKSEFPKVFTEKIHNNNQSGVTRSLPSSSNVQNKVKVEARSISRSVQRTNHPIPSSTVTRKNDNSSEDKAVVTDDNGSDSDVEKSSYENSKKTVFKETSPVEEGNKSANCITVIDEELNRQLLLAYKVSSLKELEAKLCRGSQIYHGAFGLFCKRCFKHVISLFVENCVYRFKRTMVAYPNNEFVRLIYWAQRTNIMMKNLDSSANDVCVTCDKRLTLKHLVSQKHVDKYHQKFNADPPEVALLLNREIYKQYLDSSVLADLKIRKFKKLEESPEFLTTGNEFVSLKYFLINRILQDNLVMDMDNCDLKKIVFFRENINHRSLETIFKIKNFKCYGCHKVAFKNLHDYLQHILTDRHIKNSLNQEELNNICKAMSFIEETSNGYRFKPEISRKRKQSSNNVQNGIKREKNS